MSGLSDVEKRALETLLAKKAEAERKERDERTPEQIQLEKATQEHAKLTAKLNFLKLGAYGEVTDPKKLEALRKLFKQQGNLDNLIENQLEHLNGRWSAPSKKEYRDFLSVLETHSTEIAIKTHELCELFSLTPEDKLKFESDYSENRKASKKRLRAFQELEDDGESFIIRQCKVCENIFEFDNSSGGRPPVTCGLPECQKTAKADYQRASRKGN